MLLALVLLANHFGTPIPHRHHNMGYYARPEAHRTTATVDASLAANEPATRPSTTASIAATAESKPTQPTSIAKFT